MKTIHLDATVTEDRRLIIELPPDTPLGKVKVTVRPMEETMEQIRSRFRDAGFLAIVKMPSDYRPLTDEELDELGTLPSWAAPSEDLVSEDRGEY